MASFPNKIQGTFSKNITLVDGFINIYMDNALYLTFTTNDVVVYGLKNFEIDVTNLFPDNGSYRIEIDAGFFKSGGEVTPKIIKYFNIVSGDWLNTDWDNSDWLTN